MADNKNLLLDVPPELADQIAHCLPKEGLLALRRVSKDAAARCDRAMLRYVPEELHIMFAVRWSLENALAVSKNPTWSKAVKSVTVFQEHFSEEALTDPRNFGVYNVEGSPRNVRAVRRTRWKANAKLLADQIKMAEANLDLRLLVGILSNLKGNSSGIEVLVEDSELNTSNDLCKLRAELGELWGGGEDGDYGGSLRSVLNAVQESGLQPTGFKAGGTCSGWGVQVPIHLFASPKHFGATGATFARLASLKLWLGPRPDVDHFDTGDDDIKSFIAFLKSVSAHLKRFACATSVYGFSDLYFMWDHIFSLMADEVTLAVLEHLELVDLKTDYQKFLRFVGRHARTLKSVDAENISATGCGTRLRGSRFAMKVMADLRDLGVEGALQDVEVLNKDE